MKKTKEAKSKEDIVNEFLEKVSKPPTKEDIKRLLKETPSNHVLVGSGKSEKPIIYYIQPHDYRLYFNFNKDNFNPEKVNNHTLARVLKREKLSPINNDYKYNTANYNSEHHYKNFLWCNLKVRKHTIEITNHKLGMQWLEIKGTSLNELSKKIDKVKDELDNQCIEALKTFIKIHGGSSDFKKLEKRRPEIGIHGEGYIDNIPEELIIRDTFFKKLYKKKLEMYGLAETKTYISNRVIEEIAPEIAKEINKAHSSTNELKDTINNNLNPVLKALTEQIKTHLKVQHDTLKTNKGMRKTLKDISKSLIKKHKKKKKHKHKHGLTKKEQKKMRSLQI